MIIIIITFCTLLVVFFSFLFFAEMNPDEGVANKEIQLRAVCILLA